MCKLIEIIQFVFSGLSVEGAFNWPEVANTNQIQKGKKEENQGPSVCRDQTSSFKPQISQPQKDWGP